MRRIIVVDDEPDITSGIMGCLGDRFHVNTFNDPLQALSSFRQGVYDVALIDVKMPKMNGFELYKEMYCIDPEVIFCFITAFEIRLSEFKKIFPTMKVTGFLKKPFSADELARLLEEELDYAASAH
ncbi:MAG TPA: response regulator [Nitrososphaera sp.]|nr:response regulator [Nitrososphaera sp.]